MTFQYPWMLLLIALALPALAVWLQSTRRQEERIRNFAESPLVGKVLIGRDPTIRLWHFILVYSAIALLLLAASGPQIAGGKEAIKTKGIDIVIAVDVSNSMLARDIQPSRIERAKLAMQQMLNTMNGDRLGVVVFAGEAVTMLPLTDDQSAAQMVVESISPDVITYQGTDISTAIQQATAAFVEEDKDRGKAIIIISDGENHEEDALPAVQAAVDKGIIVCALGVGTTGGDKIPEYNSKGNLTGYKKDESGNEVVSKLNDQLLRDIAQNGRGVYVQSGANDLGLGQVYSSLQGLGKTTKESFRYTNLTPIAPWLIAVAIVLLMVESLLAEGRRKENQR